MVQSFFQVMKLEENMAVQEVRRAVLKRSNKWGLWSFR
jgi:hypothetical protein